jgi:uncharacterized repeat protein (TIGR02543 family)
MFTNCSYIEAIETCDFDTSKVTNMGAMFNSCWYLRSLDVSKFDTSKVTNMEFMFSNCFVLKELDVSKFDTSEVSNMSYMFSSCISLKELALSKFDTSKVTDMGYMFSGCEELTSLDLSKFDTSKVTDMYNMFGGCKALISLDVSKFDTSKVTNMGLMFYNCSRLTSLDVSKFDTSKVTDMRSMFYGCSNLTSLDVSKFDTSNVTDMGRMFYRCSNLTSLNVSNFNVSNVEEMYWIFYQCVNLTTIYAAAGTDWGSIENINSNNMFLNCNSLKGGNDTVYDESKTDKTYARIDGLDGKPGYFTIRPGEYAIIYILPEGVTNPNPKGYTVETATITLQDVSREGYKFLGWYDAETGGNKVESIAQGSTGEKVLYARWTAVEYTITYVLQEGITNPNPGSYTVETATITLQDVSREGYKFLGWYDAETGGNKVESIAQGSSGTKKLWAYWEILTFTVTISVNDQITETRTVEYGQTTAQPADPAVDGYVFKGWVTDEGAFDFSTQIKKDMDIKARLLKKLELKSGPDIRSILLNSLSGGSAKKFAKSSEKKDSQYYLDNNQKIPVWYEQESETIWYYLEPDCIMTLAQDSSKMFANCRYIEAIETCDFDTSEVKYMNSMFSGCYNLTSLDVSNFDTSKVTNMKAMFYDCEILTSLDVSKFDTSEVTNMEYMFYGCFCLKELDLSKFDTSKVTNMNSMFVFCESLTSLDVSKFDTSKVKDMSYMFSDCTNLTSLDVSKFDTSEVTNMEAMFCNCFVLKELDVSKFDTSKVTNMGCMFSDCHGLTNLKISNFNTSKFTDMRSMFRSCFNLTTIYAAAGTDWGSIENISSDNMFLNCNSLKGGNNTVYDESKTDKTYARIDGLDGKPGYFTVKPAATE